MSDIVNTADACARCESLFGPERRSLKMWDGKCYCVECIRSVAPELLDWAREHAYLEETLPLEAISRKKYFQNNYLYPVIGILFILLLVSFWASGVWMAFSLLMLAPIGFVGLIALLDWKYDFAGSRAAQELPRTLVVQNNQLIVVHEQESQCYHLSEFHYYESDTNRTVDNLYLENRSALILEKASGWNWQRFEFEEVRYACGLTPEKRVLWSSFFELIELPRKEVMSTRRYHLLIFLLVVTFLLVFCTIIFQSPAVGFSLLTILMWILPLQTLNTAKRISTKVVAVVSTLLTNGFVFYAFASRNPVHAGLYCLMQLCLFLVVGLFLKRRIRASDQEAS